MGEPDACEMRHVGAAAAKRRAQIVRATILVLVDLGSSRTSFAAIAVRAGLSSTRLISYHFEDRADLMRTVAVTVTAEMGAAVEAAMRSASSPREAIHAYLQANVSYVDTHRSEVIALAALLFAGDMSAGSSGSSATERALAELIQVGVDCGEFGSVNAAVAAGVLQRAVEGVAWQIYRNRDIDLSTLGDDLVTFFDTGLGVGVHSRAGRSR